MKRALFSVVMAGLLSACSGGGSKNLNAADYNQTCAVDADCVGVSTQNLCAACRGCGANAAINKKDKNRFDSDVDAVQTQCLPSPPTTCPADDCAFSAP